jgi:selenide,water dikinase
MSDLRTQTLTALCSSGGCAAKYDGVLLRSLLERIPSASDPNLLVGLDPADDAAVLRISESQALVFTVDFFPPVVDDPKTFGRIAANNALNDVYAMGGRPALALSVAAFPEELPPEILADVVAGAASQCSEVGVILAGGHTIRDAEPKFGLAVAGFVDPHRIWLKSGAQVGDVLVLTKPLGTGLIITGQRKGVLREGELDATIRWLLMPNSSTVEILRAHAPNAVTDVTGFGLLGHAHEVASSSNVRLTIALSTMPLVPGAQRLAAAGVVTSGDSRNRGLVPEALAGASHLDSALLVVALDPQTAGGLLISLPPSNAEALVQELAESGLRATQVGTVGLGAGLTIIE